jgi:hypothetical protein
MNTVSGLFERYSKAEWALEVLGLYGIQNYQISVTARGSRNVALAAAISQFTEMGFAKEEAEFYAEGVRRGGFLVSVALDSQQDEYLISGILRSAGAVDMNTFRPVWQVGSTYILNSNMYIQESK